MKINLSNLTISKVKELYHQGELSSRELVSAYLEEIEKKNENINAYLEVFDDVFEKAEEIDKHFAHREELKPLEGIPFAIKDNILIKGKKCSAGSRILENYTAVYDAGVIKKLKAAGAIFLGRTNMDEFAMGSSTENSAFGPTKNPFDFSRVPGGSSGGSAAAVAADMALGALGSDTGGSVRQPAAFCGIVGLKPTYGAVSRFGLIAMASSLDQIGPFVKNIEDAEIVFEVIRGKDSLDSTSVDYKIGAAVDQPTVGLIKELMDYAEKSSGGTDRRIFDNLSEAIEVLKSKGCKIKEVSIPHIKYSLAVYQIVVPAEISANLSRYDGIRYGKQGSDVRKRYFGHEVKRRIILGAYVLSAGYCEAYYIKAGQVRRLITDDFQKVFKEVDILILPTAPTLPFMIGEKIKDPLAMYFSDLFTVPANLAGLPSLSLPFGIPTVGIQLIGPWFGESGLFKAGKLLEKF